MSIIETEPVVADDFEIWLNGRPKWLQTAARMLIDSKRQLNQDEIKTLATLCKLEAKDEADPRFLTVTPGALSQVANRPLLRIEEILDVHGLNAIKAGANLQFGKSNLSVIYGQNGTGKSGFARLLKEICGSRSKDEIRSKAHRYEPDINPSYRDLAEHYGVAGHLRSPHKGRHTTQTEHMPNIMSLGGIAIAIGAMVDAAVVMIENAHKKIEAWHAANPGEELKGERHWHVMTEAAAEVGPALFFCLLIITLSFIPVFTLEAQEGRLFGPLAFTKTYAMAAAAGLSVTLVPVLMGYWIRGRIPSEHQNPLNRWLIRIYQPALDAVLCRPKITLLVALLVVVSTLWPMSRLGGEFLPPLDEGDLLYMPSALPGLSAQKAAQLLQQTDRLIKTVPEVEHVFGKAGRAETATDPAPLEMFETTIQFKPHEQWRPGMTQEKLVEELDRVVRVPGLTNIWIPPIRNRIDMLATGIKSPIGVKVAGTNLTEIDAVTQAVERVAKDVPGVSSALAERLTGGRYIDVDIDRKAAARYGLNIADVQSIVAGAIGGENVGETIEGLARFPINVRYPREWRDSLGALAQLPIYTPLGSQITLGTVAKIKVSDGPPMLKSENARPSGWVYIDVRGRDIASVVADLRRVINEQVKLQPGMSLSYSGQFEFLERANARLKLVVPATLLIIFVLLYLTFARFDEALLIMATLPFALSGGAWFLYLLGFNLSVATGVGFIALAGVSAEFGVIMLLYLKNAWAERENVGDSTERGLIAAIREGAVQRVRPKAMTVAVIIAGLLPILLGSGTGSEVMSRIAAPMVGGMVTAPLLSLFVIPAAYRLMRRRHLLVEPTKSEGSRATTVSIKK